MADAMSDKAKQAHLLVAWLCGGCGNQIHSPEHDSRCGACRTAHDAIDAAVAEQQTCQLFRHDGETLTRCEKCIQQKIVGIRAEQKPSPDLDKALAVVKKLQGCPCPMCPPCIELLCEELETALVSASAKPKENHAEDHL